MSKSATVSTRFGLDADGGGPLDPLFWGECEAVEASLFSNPVEFDGIKLGVVKSLPDTE